MAGVGDHPLTDILFLKLEGYGREADDLFAKFRSFAADESWRNGGTRDRLVGG
jgi:hypothetical protein